MMRKIFTIAKTELHTLFYSPVAWLMLALFTLLTGLDYIDRIDILLRNDELGGSFAQYIQYLSRLITYSDEHSVFYKIINNVYIFLPLLTMGLISRETASGTIKLLYSSPLRIREIVLGKYLAIVTFILFMTAIAGLMVIGLCFSITNPDVPQLLTSLLGLFLTMCCYAALGLFISSLTSYLVVAAIVTCMILGFMSQAGLYWQDFAVVREITYYLNMSYKSHYFLIGLLNLRDFFYFLIMSGTFLAFAMIRLKSGTESISKWRLVTRYVAVIAVAGLCGYITSRKDLNMYVDTTRGQDFTISKPTQDLLKQIDAHEFDITLYINILNGGAFSMTPRRQVYIEREILEPYYRFKPYMKLKFVYYYNADSTNWRFQVHAGKTLTEIAENEAKQQMIEFSEVLSPEAVSRLIEVEAERNMSFFHIRYGDQEMIVRIFEDIGMWPSEYEFAAAWQRLVITPPKLMFLSGEMERDPFSKRRYHYGESITDKENRHSLLNQGFDVDTLSLKNGDAPQDIAALVIADPRLPLSPAKIDKINKYIDTGGNLLLLTEPDTWQNLQPVLEKVGVTIKPGMIVQPSMQYSSDDVFPNVTDTAQNLSPFFMRAINDRLKYFGDTAIAIRMRTVSALEYKAVDGFTVEPLLVTDRKYSWNRTAPISQEDLRGALGSAPGDEHGDFVTSVRMYRNVNGKEQRIIVAGDADYLSRDGLVNSKYGSQYQLWCYRYFTYGKFPAMTLRPESIDNDFTIMDKGVFIQEILFCWILPSLLGITGIVILIRRKRK